MKLGIRLTVDIVFLNVFARQENANLTLGFLNSFLPLVGRPRASSLTILNPVSPGTFHHDKGVILDVKAQDETGRTFQMEMQVRRFGHLNRRMLDTWARLYSRQVRKGDDYDLHLPLISLWIMEGDYFRDGRWIHAFRTVDPGSGHELCEDFLIVTIELRPWRRLILRSAGGSIEGEANQWLYLLSQSQEIDTDAIPGFLRVPAIREAIDIMGAFTKSEAERDLYERRLEYQRSESCIRREDYNKGIRVGEARGEAKGRAEGLAEGEFRKAREMARALLAEGMPEAFILKTTGLSPADIEALR